MNIQWCLLDVQSDPLVSWREWNSTMAELSKLDYRDKGLSLPWRREGNVSQVMKGHSKEVLDGWLAAKISIRGYWLSVTNHIVLMSHQLFQEQEIINHGSSLDCLMMRGSSTCPRLKALAELIWAALGLTTGNAIHLEIKYCCRQSIITHVLSMPKPCYFFTQSRCLLCVTWHKQVHGCLGSYVLSCCGHTPRAFLSV